MPRRCHLLAISIFFLALVAPAVGQIRVNLGDPAPEFPPGVFSDGQQHRLADYKEKAVVVLWFFDGSIKQTRDSVPERAAVIMAMKGKPVKFFGIAANLNLAGATAFQKQTGLAMPIYPDTLGLMEARYGFKIGKQNIWQFRVLSQNRFENVTMDKEAVEKAVEKTTFEHKYKAEDYDAKVKPALELFEYGQYAAGFKLANPLVKGVSKKTAESAKKLVDEARGEVEKWKSEADDAASAEPLKAYDLYQKAATALPADAVGKASSAAAKKLATEKAVASELAARKAFTDIVTKMGQSNISAKPAIAAMCKGLTKKYAGTPTAEKANDLLEELGGKAGK